MGQKGEYQKKTPVMRSTTGREDYLKGLGIKITFSKHKL
jgi:hypothetical protein